MKIRIYYEDTDCGGVVYYANYLRYLERARTEFFEDRGLNIKKMMSDGVQFIITGAALDFRSPAFYGDILDIETSVSKTSLASFELSYKVKRADTGKLIVDATTSMACINKEMKPTRPSRKLQPIV